MSPDPRTPTSPRTSGQQGVLLVVSGPSGAGKSTVCHELLRRLPDATWSVSATTRPPRGTEVDGCDYYFVSRERFDRMIQAGELCEWAEYLGNLYGTPRAPVAKALAAGQVMVMEIDVQGGRQIAEKMPDSVRVFLLPPNDEELARRLMGRQTETPEQQAGRLAKARQEIAWVREWGCYQYFIVNESVERTVQDVMRILEAERNKT